MRAAIPTATASTILRSSSAAATRRALARATSPKAPATSFFQTEIGIANPGTLPTTVVTRFLGDNGRTWSGAFPIPARQSRTVIADGRFAASFSTVIESDQPVVADRVMTWGGGYGSPPRPRPRPRR